MNTGYSLKKYKPLLVPVLILFTLIILSAIGSEVQFKGFWKGILTGGDFIKGLFPPEPGAFFDMLYPALQTVFLAVIATPLGVLFAFISAILATSNISPPWVRSISRSFMAAERALPEIIVAYFFIAAFGVGPMPGIIAMAIGCIGMLGKLFADAMEEVDPKLLEALECVGASKVQVFRYGIIPEVLPSMISNTLFRFEVNIRNSTLLGAVGAGGIGYELREAINLLEYRRATTAIIVTLTLIFITERISEYVRHHLISKERLS